jgi:hypothetical protein
MILSKTTEKRHPKRITSMLLHAQTKTQFNDLLNAKKIWSARVLRAPRPTGFQALAAASGAEPNQNVMGVGIGEKFEGNKPTGVMAVKFFVRRKYAENELSKAELLPKSVAGLPVDVEEVGVFRAFAKRRKTSQAMPNPKTRFRPAQPGCSLRYQFPAPSTLVMAGTFGAVVKNSGGTYVLSNNHVLADEGRLPPGSDIFQPGLLDGGNASSDKIAKLTLFIPLQVGVFNHVDCAIAKGNSASVLSRDILHIGPPIGTTAATIDMRVHKFGRTTSYTVGHITSIATDVTVSYETGNFTFENQIIIVGDNGPFSLSGDSGSLILERQTNTAVGLLFAGSNTHTIANHIGNVLQALKVTLA